MAVCLRCNLCERPGTLSEAVEVAQVPCNVRQFRNDFFTIWRCTGCGSLHCKEDADLASYYADYPLKKQALAFSQRVGYANRARLLKRQGVRNSHRILDYGCGYGIFVKYLRENGFPDVTGYDPYVAAYSNPAALQHEYDTVVSYDVIEHYQDPREFLDGIGSLVRPGGLLVIGTPNADHLSLSSIRDPGLHPPYHRHIFSERMLLTLAREQGMEPVDIHRRSFYDTLVPTVNSRFMWRYVENSEGLLDAAVEPPNAKLVLRSPEMVMLMFFGYLMPAGDNILVTFRKNRVQPPRVSEINCRNSAPVS
jgi:SAM-dependent methyltransferase